MAIRATKSKTLIPCWGYLRMSTNDQLSSIESQRGALAEYGSKMGRNYTRWYVDEGISGDETKRPDFNRMMADSKRATDGERIVCWNMDRFSRAAHAKTIWFVQEFADAGFSIELAGPEEIVDIDNIAGMLTAVVNAYSNHAVLPARARDISRQHTTLINQGLWANGAPLGYVIKDKRLEIDPDTAPLVKMLYEEYLKHPGGLGGLANDLNARGIPSPNIAKKKKTQKGIWCPDSVEYILRNEANIGHAIFNKTPSGKHIRTINGEQVETKKGDPRRIFLPRSECNVHENTHQPIITLAVFRKTQARLEERSFRRTRENSYLLSGIMVCGHCGGPIYGKADSSNGKLYHKYYCNAKTHPECRFTLRASTVERAVIDGLLGQYLTDDKIEEYRETAYTYVKQKQSQNDDCEKQLKKSIDNLNRKISNLMDQLEDAPKDIARDMHKRMSELKTERGKLDAQLRVEQDLNASFEDTLGVDARKLVQLLRGIRTRLQDTNQQLVHAAIRQMVHHIELHTRPARPDVKRPGGFKPKREFKELIFHFEKTMKTAANMQEEDKSSGIRTHISLLRKWCGEIAALA